MLQANAVSGATLDVLKTLSRQSWIKDFNLVGGTALALYWGHRISIDVDYFSDQNINLDDLEGKINKVSGAMLVSKNPISLVYTINNIKSDFVNFPYRFFYRPQNKEQFFIAHIDDVVSLKLGALANRGAKKDFYDLYYILQQYNLDQLTELYKNKFKVADILPLLKSLLYFGDAEDELPPDLVKNKQLTWPQVKKFIVQQVKKQVK